MKKMPFYELGKLKLKGKVFKSGGAWLLKHKKTGMLGGVLYAYPKEKKVGDWIGKWKVPAKFGGEWVSNMGDKRQHVKFNIGKKRFSGIYFKSGSDIIRVRQLKKVM